MLIGPQGSNDMRKYGLTHPAASGWWLSTVITFLLAGCVSHQPVESKYETIRTELQPGDRVKVTLSSGEEFSLKVTELREMEIVGDTSTDITRGRIVTVPLADIQELVRVDREHGKELALIGGSFAGVVALAFLTAAALFASF